MSAPIERVIAAITLCALAAASGCSEARQRARVSTRTAASAVAAVHSTHPPPVGAGSPRRRIAIVAGEDLWDTPPVPEGDARYQSWVEGVAYRTAVIRLARRTGIALTDAERSLAMSSIPSENASERYRASHGIPYERFVAERLDTALIQKMEQRELRSKVRPPSEAELHGAYDNDPQRPSGAIAIVTLLRVGRGCGGEQDSRAVDLAHRAVLAKRRSHGHRVALEGPGASLPSDVQPFDVHVDSNAGTRFVAPYGHEDLDVAPEQMPARIGELVASWSKLSSPGSVFGPKCSEGATWVAIKVEGLPGTAAEFEQVRDEYVQRAETEALREAFVGWVATVKREADVRILDATRS